MTTITNGTAYYQGMADCSEGIEAKQGKHPDYYRGYGSQYDHEQNMAAMTSGLNIVNDSTEFNKLWDKV